VQLQGTVHGGDGHIEQIGDLAGLPIEHVTQDQYRAPGSLLHDAGGAHG
jgi:hypothetical protein